MSDEDVYSALTAAVQEDAAVEEQADEDAPSVATPEGEDEEQAPEPEEGEEEHSAEEEVVDDPTSEQFNPDTLPPELLPAWKQLQRAFTPKLQEAAELKKQLGGLPVDDVQNAVELYTRISDPSTWPQLLQELTEAMQQYGIDPGAEQDTGAPVQPAAPALDLSGLADDPELAPLAEALSGLQATNSALQARLDAIEAQRQADLAQAEALAQQHERTEALRAQLAEIQEAHPHYQEDDLKDILMLGSFFGDDLLAAQEAFENSFHRRMERYLASKERSKSPSTTAPRKAAAPSQEDKQPQTLEEVEAEAVEYLRGLQAQGLLD